MISADNSFRPVNAKSSMTQTTQNTAMRGMILAIIALALFPSCTFADSPSSRSQPLDRQEDIDDLIADLPVAGDKADMVTKIEIVVELVKYDDQYYRFHFTDGGYEAHKISAFLIVEPAEFSGKSLNIRHADSPQPDSIWRSEGAVLRLRLLRSDVEFIAGANGSLGVQLVEVVEPD